MPKLLPYGEATQPKGRALRIKRFEQCPGGLVLAEGSLAGSEPCPHASGTDVAICLRHGHGLNTRLPESALWNRCAARRRIPLKCTAGASPVLEQTIIAFSTDGAAIGLDASQISTASTATYPRIPCSAIPRTETSHCRSPLPVLRSAHQTRSVIFSVRGR